MGAIAILGLVVIGGGFLFLMILVFWFVIGYNTLVSMRNAVKEAWAQIDVQLKRRHDLIPNLVETVKGYAGHERETLEAVVQARSAAVAAKGPAEAAAAEQALGGALGRMMLLVEQYPDLKANQNFLALQEELTSTENKIGFSRQYYNDTVMQYNTSCQKIPNNLLAGMFHFQPEPYYEIADAAQREAPQVKF